MFLAIFDEKIEIRERCKGVHCVDLGESFPTHILLQNLASIQLLTSPVKFARSPRAWQSPPIQVVEARKAAHASERVSAVADLRRQEERLQRLQEATHIFLHVVCVKVKKSKDTIE